MSSHNSTIPLDDGHLEMEEIEGLIQVSNPRTSAASSAGSTTSGIGAGRSSNSNNSNASSSMISSWLGDPQKRKRLVGIGFLFLGIIILWIAQQEGGEQADAVLPHLVDVELKDHPHNSQQQQQQQPQVIDIQSNDGTTVEHHINNDNKNQNKLDNIVIIDGKKKEEEEKAAAEAAAAAKKKADEEAAAKKKADEEAAAKNKAEEKPAPAPAPAPKKTSKIPELDKFPDHVEPTDAERDELTEKYGHWHFWDGDADLRPKEDYLSKHPNKDIPGDDFPDSSWQVDAVYVNHFLNDADELVARAMEAIYSEYGHGKPLPPEQLTIRHQMFRWEMIDMATQEGPPANFARRSKRDTGGWTTKRSNEGLVRRLLHAMMTQDTFTIVLGGHSAAAGAGNYFRHSYIMQVYRILKPIFDRLNVKLTVRNICQGGMGTIQHSLGSTSILGDSIDLLLWDTGMTEGSALDHIDLFFRQGLLGGDRVPVIWASGYMAFPLLKLLHEEVGADVGEWGTGMIGINETLNAEQMKSLPYAIHGMKCPDEEGDFCKSVEQWYCECWFDRPDGIKPKVNQRKFCKGRAGWHPTWRHHQLTGRVIAFRILESLQSAINIWSSGTMSGQPLDDEYWHVTEYYDNIRTKLKALDESKGECYKIKQSSNLPTRLCTTPMKGRTQATPRANSEQTSLSSIIKPAPDGYVPKNDKKAMYEGPDVHNPGFDIPKGEVDVLAIIQNRRRRRLATTSTTATTTYQLFTRTMSGTNDAITRALKVGVQDFKQKLDLRIMRNNRTKSSLLRAATTTNNKNNMRRLDDKIVPGTGWELRDEPQGKCDGEYMSVCGLSADNECVLSGHHDARGYIIGDEYSGWLVMNLQALKEGLILMKLESWHVAADHPRTRGWNTVNNDKAAKAEDNRDLRTNYDMVELPDSFIFDYAINGKITSLDKKTFVEKLKKVQRVVEVITILDDENFTSGKEQDVEVAIRMRECGHDCNIAISHIYWA